MGIDHLYLVIEGIEIYKGHSMYENTTSQYNNIYQGKKFPDLFAILGRHP